MVIECWEISKEKGGEKDRVLKNSRMSAVIKSIWRWWVKKISYLKIWQVRDYRIRSGFISVITLKLIRLFSLIIFIKVLTQIHVPWFECKVGDEKFRPIKLVTIYRDIDTSSDFIAMKSWSKSVTALRISISFFRKQIAL